MAKKEFGDPTDGLHRKLAQATAQGIREVAKEVLDQRNRDFKQVYERGWERIRALADVSHSTLPLKLWTFLAQEADSTMAVTASYSTLAAALKVSEKSIQRAAATLEKADAIRRLKLSERGGTSYVFALDPREVWGGFKDGKDHAPFITKTIVPRRGNEEVIARGMRTLIEREQAAPAKAKGRSKPPATEPTPAELEAAGQQRLPLGDGSTLTGDADLMAVLHAAE